MSEWKEVLATGAAWCFIILTIGVLYALIKFLYSWLIH